MLEKDNDSQVVVSMFEKEGEEEDNKKEEHEEDN